MCRFSKFYKRPNNRYSLDYQMCNPMRMTIDFQITNFL